PLRLGTAGEEHVGAAVEEHEHGHVLEAAGALLQTEVEASGHAAHGADLQVEHHQVGRVVGHLVPHLGPAVDAVDGGVGAAQHGPDLVVEPLGVRGHQHPRHGPGGYLLI